MPQIINTNIASLNAQRNLNRSQGDLNVSLQRLSSGLRINSAKDDAAGLAISERFTSQIRGLNQAVRNANDGISLAQTAEGALGEIANNVQRIRELAIQSANATNSASDRQALNDEAQQLIAEIDRVATQTTFNGRNLFDGSFSAQNFQIGANANETIGISVESARTASLGAFATLQTDANTNLGRIASGAAFSGASTDANQLQSDELVINNQQVGAASSDNISTSEASNSAIAIANAINASVSDVTASADENVINLGSITAGSLVNEGLSINGVNIGAVTVVGGDTDDALQEAINAQQNVTGVVASKTSGQLILTAQDGRNITLAQNNNAVNAAAILGDADGGAPDATGAVFTAFAAVSTASSATFRAQVSVVSSNTISVADGSSGAAAEVGFSATSAVVNASTSLSNVDLTSFNDATDALQTLDTALDTINSQRATLGATQTRFESTIANLSTTSENLTAARSRILDADFAVETAALTRAQILQQAGTSILAQANSLPQNALALLQ